KRPPATISPLARLNQAARRSALVSADHSCSGATAKLWARETVLPFFAGETVRVTSSSWESGVTVEGDMGLLGRWSAERRWTGAECAEWAEWAALWGGGGGGMRCEQRDAGPTVSGAGGAAQTHDDLRVRGVGEHVDEASGDDAQRGHRREISGQRLGIAAGVDD